jgi:hypothetical protein
MKDMNKSPKKKWQRPELTLLSEGYINGGGPHVGFHEHGHNGGNYYIQNTHGAPLPVGKGTFDQYQHS